MEPYQLTSLCRPLNSELQTCRANDDYRTGNTRPGLVLHLSRLLVTMKPNCSVLCIFTQSLALQISGWVDLTGDVGGEGKHVFSKVMADFEVAFTRSVVVTSHNEWYVEVKDHHHWMGHHQQFNPLLTLSVFSSMWMPATFVEELQMRNTSQLQA